MSSVLQKVRSILVSAPRRLTRGVVTGVSIGVVGTAASLVAACGQKGPLYLPQTPDAAQRASLPASVFGTAPAAPASAPASLPGAAAPTALAQPPAP